MPSIEDIDITTFPQATKKGLLNELCTVEIYRRHMNRLLVENIVANSLQIPEADSTEILEIAFALHIKNPLISISKLKVEAEDLRAAGVTIFPEYPDLSLFTEADFTFCKNEAEVKYQNHYDALMLYYYPDP